MDINFTLLTGTIVTTPSWFPLSNNKRALIFTILSRESFKLSDGNRAHHDNLVTVEVLGRNADKYFDELKRDSRYQVVGYLRVDEIKGEVRTRIRAFRIEECYGN